MNADNTAGLFNELISGPLERTELFDARPDAECYATTGEDCQESCPDERELAPDDFEGESLFDAQDRYSGQVRGRVTQTARRDR